MNHNSQQAHERAEKRRARSARYDHSEKGRARRRRYNRSKKGCGSNAIGRNSYERRLLKRLLTGLHRSRQ